MPPLPVGRLSELAVEVMPLKEEAGLELFFPESEKVALGLRRLDRIEASPALGALGLMPLLLKLVVP